MPLLRKDALAKESDRVWEERERLLRGIRYDEELHGIPKSQPRQFVKGVGETFVNTSTGPDVSEAEAELRSLQDALRFRRSYELAAATDYRVRDLNTPSRVEKISSPPDSPEDLKTAMDDFQGPPAGGSGHPASPPRAQPDEEKKKTKTKESDKDKEEPADKKKPTRPPWQSVCDTPLQEHVDPPRAPIPENERRSGAEVCLSLYKRAKEDEKTKQTKMERKARELNTLIDPQITKLGKESRPKTPRRELGEYYFAKGNAMREMKEKTLERKRAELLKNEGLQSKPVITKLGMDMKAEDQTPEEISNDLFKRGVAFYKLQEERLNRKRTPKTEGATFKPDIDKRSRYMASGNDNRYDTLIEKQCDKEGRAPSGKGGRMYDKGKVFATNREEVLKRKRDEKKIKEVEEMKNPQLSNRSRKLMARATSQGRRIPPGMTEPQSPQMRTPARLRIPSHSPLRSPSPGSPVRQVNGLNNNNFDDDDDLLEPPSIDRIISEVRLRQEMRRLGV
eukprot:TRINITY_DN3041_c0_g2_i1.p1 TRINITY_DN3041_c0_g2~~TRINITY_DN3041_c0_g2_i1.p1  ORF type:complete len:507 (+),score=118.75 TRINITY_DN3041_c0_g2_i1:2622-4142(+)